MMHGPIHIRVHKTIKQNVIFTAITRNIYIAKAEKFVF